MISYFQQEQDLAMFLHKGHIFSPIKFLNKSEQCWFGKPCTDGQGQRFEWKSQDYIIASPIVVYSI